MAGLPVDAGRASGRRPGALPRRVRAAGELGRRRAVVGADVPRLSRDSATPLRPRASPTRRPRPRRARGRGEVALRPGVRRNQPRLGAVAARPGHRGRAAAAVGRPRRAGGAVGRRGGGGDRAALQPRPPAARAGGADSGEPGRLCARARGRTRRPARRVGRRRPGRGADRRPRLAGALGGADRPPPTLAPAGRPTSAAGRGSPRSAGSATAFGTCAARRPTCSP